jgi:hypothetical protein
MSRLKLVENMDLDDELDEYDEEYEEEPFGRYFSFHPKLSSCCFNLGMC